jgi:hypothetical protein
VASYSIRPTTGGFSTLGLDSVIGMLSIGLGEASVNWCHEVAADAAGLASGSGWRRFDALNNRLDVIYKGVIAAQLRAAADVDAMLQKLCDAVVGPPDAKGADKPGTPEPAPPPPPPGSPNGAQNKQPAQAPSH